jgi:hypothetical protein
MNYLPRLFLGAAFLAPLAASGQVNTATQASNPASVRIYIPIQLSVGTNLSFGDVFAAGTSSTVVLDPVAGGRTLTGGGSLGTASVAAPASFTVSGKRGASYAITLPSDTAVTLAGPGTALVVKTFQASVAGGAASSAPTGTISGTTPFNQTFTVGATLVVAANQTDGNYSGNYAVTVTYD